MEPIARRLSRLVSGVGTPAVTLFLLATVCAIPVKASFTGYYDLNNWSVFNSSADGWITSAHSGDTLVLTGGNDQSGNTGLTYAWLIAPSNLFVSFSYTFLSLDALEDDPAHPVWDIGGYVNSGIFFPLSLDTTAANNRSFRVRSGEIFGFGVKTVDNWGGPGQLSVTDFDVRSVPEPSAEWPMLVVMGSAAVAARRLRSFAAGG